jgi:predicted enzyme related to lactoylglutathione lyase
LLNELRSSGIEVLEKTEEFEYGKFGWLMDPEGNKLELWEPNDEKLIS